MPVLESHVDRNGAEFRENLAHMESLVADLKKRLAADTTSTVKYDGEKPQELLDEDKLISTWALDLTSLTL